MIKIIILEILFKKVAPVVQTSILKPLKLQWANFLLQGLNLEVDFVRKSL